MEAFTVVCALVALVCALAAALASRRCVQAWQEAQAALRGASSLRGTVEGHSSELEAMRDSLHKLRGKFYAERRQPQPGAVDRPEQSAADLKAQLRQQLGLVPGRRP